MKTFIVDSFTDTPFKGNPAGVCILRTHLSDETMLSVAQELNLSETAFVVAADNSEGFRIRYFSPKMEIPLCGHATLASARVLFATLGLKQARFTTINDVELSALMSEDRISMVFPVYETRPASAPAPLLAALGISAVNNVAYNDETKILLLEIAEARVLADLNPDFTALYHSHSSINGVLVTAPSDTDAYDFHSRYFWPWSGTNEDPVTGGTHTFLAKYWAQRLGTSKMRSYQSSKRSGYMDVELLDGRVIISSQAIISLAGTMFV